MSSQLILSRITCEIIRNMSTDPPVTLNYNPGDSSVLKLMP